MSFFLSPEDLTASDDSELSTSSNGHGCKPGNKQQSNNAENPAYSSQSGIEATTSVQQPTPIDRVQESLPTPLDRIETIESSHKRYPSVNEVSSSSAAATTVFTTQVDDMKTSNAEALMMFASLQRTAQAEALAELIEHGSSGPYSKDHSDVVALAMDKYTFMVKSLRPLGFIPPTEYQAVQRQELARRGLEMISARGPSLDRPGVTSRQLSKAVGGLNQVMQLVSLTNNLPPLLKDHLGHPVLKTSRYSETFEEIKFLGEGGFGKVYHVRHKLSEAEFAVKKIKVSSARIKRIRENGKDELDALLAELRTLSRLDHPNIVRFHDGWLEQNLGTAVTITDPQSRISSPKQPAALPKLLASPATTREVESDERASRAVVQQSESRLPSLTNRPNSNSGVEIIFESTEGQLSEPESQSYRSSLSQLSASQKSMPSIKTAAGDKLPSALIHGSPHLRMLSHASTLPSTTDSEGSELSGPHLVLHLQMALHPFTLAEFISPPSPDLTHVRHCFHVKQALRILLEILDGVQYLHLQGLAHRDLKPSNILISVYKESGYGKCFGLADCSDCRDAGVCRSTHLNVRIGDFGLATEIAYPGANGLEAPLTPSNPVGTRLYRPLKVAAEGNEEKMDVYALAIIAFELLVPFDTRMERYQELMILKHGGVPTELAHRLGDTYTEVREALLEMLSADACKRPTCAEVRDWVLELLS